MRLRDGQGRHESAWAIYGVDGSSLKNNRSMCDWHNAKRAGFSDTRLDMNEEAVVGELCRAVESPEICVND